MNLSVHIVSCGRLVYLEACCKSVITALPKSAEVLIVVNGDYPEVIQFLKNFKHSQFRWIQIPSESLSSARNRAFELCRGKIIYFLDDDVIVPTHLFKSAIELFEKDPELIVAGGANLTPPESPLIEKCFGAVMTSFFAAPMVRHRYCLPKKNFQIATQHNVIFCNLACRRDLIPKDLYFLDELSSNQENFFLYLIGQLKIKAVLSSDLYVFHYRRKNILSFAKQVCSYGFGRFQQTWKCWQSCHPLYLVPPLALVSFLTLIITGRYQIMLALLAIYSFLSLAAALCSDSIRELGTWGIVSALPLTAMVHLTYGLGWLSGLWSKFKASE
jgi:glycosyltransferase involved in cell wall biosynthesis